MKIVKYAKCAVPSLSVVIPTKNSIKTIDKCLSSLMPYYRQGYINEIVVVDGHSTDGTLDAIKCYPVKLISDGGQGNIGFAYDIGWRYAKGDIIILLDSDVYLGEGFFPSAHDLLSADVGWISCEAKAVVTNRLTKLQGEYWKWSTPILHHSPSAFQRLYGKIAYGGSQTPKCGGPCMIVRRICLEEVDGFQNLGLETLRCCGDVSVSQRIANRGWKTIWWPDAPVYHRPRTTLKGLTKQYYEYGKSIAYMQAEKEFRDAYTRHGKVIGIFARLASPVLGLIIAFRFRNTLHVVVYSIPRYAVAVGYIVGWVGSKNLMKKWR